MTVKLHFLTIISSISKLLLSSLAHWGPTHGCVHACGGSDVGRGAEASGGGCRSCLLLLLLHEHHHPLAAHLQSHHLPAALGQHLSIQEALRTPWGVGGGVGKKRGEGEEV